MSIEIQNLTKYYGKKRALNNVSLKFENGIYGLLGANGAGKSTLINIMVTSLTPTSGKILYNGENTVSSKAYLNSLGFMPQSLRFYKNYTAEEFLKYMAALKGVKLNGSSKLDELFELVNLSKARKQKVGGFSGGMLRRLGIAQALLNDPELLILDEPTAGLDPKERIRFRNLIASISGNRTVIIATHIVPDIEYIADKVILMNNGEIIKNGTPYDLCEEINNKVWLVRVSEDEAENIITKYKISNIHREDEFYFIKIVSDEKPFPLAKSVTPSLEDVFLYHAGEIEI